MDRLRRDDRRVARRLRVGRAPLPKDLKPGERRPVVVCQHGLEGVPADTITDDPKSQAYGFYKAYGARLAERGFIVFAPHNPYRGQDAFRTLQRKANPLGRTLFSVILAQHDRILDWLSEQPFVDPARIGLYGLSYGGKTAMRVACVARPLLPLHLLRRLQRMGDQERHGRFTLQLHVHRRIRDLRVGPRAHLQLRRDGRTHRSASLHGRAWTRRWRRARRMGRPRIARVRRFYNKLGIGDRAEIEFFKGPHTINGQGTFEFLHKHLQWPEVK